MSLLISNHGRKGVARGEGLVVRDNGVAGKGFQGRQEEVIQGGGAGTRGNKASSISVCVT